MSVFVFVLSLVVTILGFVYLMNRLQIDKNQGVYREDEAVLMQELHRGLVKMEQRIETLETLLLERDRMESHDRAMMS
jgi:phage shock protein B